MEGLGVNLTEYNVDNDSKKIAEMKKIERRVSDGAAY
jgi:hypothetical protein